MVKQEMTCDIHYKRQNFIKVVPVEKLVRMDAWIFKAKEHGMERIDIHGCKLIKVLFKGFFSQDFTILDDLFYETLFNKNPLVSILVFTSCVILCNQACSPKISRDHFYVKFGNLRMLFSFSVVFLSAITHTYEH